MPVEQITTTKDEIMPNTLRVTMEHVQTDLVGVVERMRENEILLRQAQKVVILVGCDDSRVGVPITMVDDTMYIYLPVIGGGIPERETLTTVLIYLRTLGISVSGKVTILLTQHGDSREIDLVLSNHEEEACRHITCGLRGVIEAHRQQFQTLRHALKGFLRNQNASDFLIAGALIDELATDLGIPKRLILRAVMNNQSSYMQSNLRAVLEEVNSYALGVKAIQTGYYDHQAKKVTLLGRFTKQVGDAIEFPLSTWDHAYQDPAVIAIAFGPRAASTNKGVILPTIIGGQPGNSFNATAVATKFHLLDALAETWYAASSSAGGHGQNFSSTNGCIIFCDNDQFVNAANDVLNSKEFRTEMRDAYVQLGPMLIANLVSGEVTEFKFEEESAHPTG